MDALKAHLKKIQDQLNGLSASQKMLTMSLVAIMVMTLVWWGRYASVAEMEPLLNQPFAAEELSRITNSLDMKGVKYSISGDKILVPSERKIAILGDLSYNNLMPSDTHKGYEDMLKLDNAWNTASKSEAIRVDAKAAYLGEIIRTFRGVATANVIIDATSERRIGNDGKQPKATVHVSLREGAEASARQLARAASALVSGAMSGLDQQNVTVVVNGQVMPSADKANGVAIGNELMEQQFALSRMFVDRIKDNLSYIPNIFVAVNAELEIKSTQSTGIEYDPATTVSKMKRETNNSSDDHNSAPPGGEPGAAPNVGISLESHAAPSETSSTKEHGNTEMENRFGQKTTQIVAPAGQPLAKSASVRIPRSYFVQIWKAASHNTPSAAEPDDQALKAIVDIEIPKVQKLVKACTFIKNEEDITVDTYFDLPPVMLAGISTTTATPASQSSAIGGIVSGHGKEIAMAALALVSLYMVSTIVRKGAPTPALATAGAASAASTAEAKAKAAARNLSGSEEVIGLASGGNTTLDALELDSDSVQAQQMVEQVSTMVKENPDAAAALMKRWLAK